MTTLSPILTAAPIKSSSPAPAGPTTAKKAESKIKKFLKALLGCLACTHV